jgi:hypothetical protein
VRTTARGWAEAELAAYRKCLLVRVGVLMVKHCAAHGLP